MDDVMTDEEYEYGPTVAYADHPEEYERQAAIALYARLNDWLFDFRGLSRLTQWDLLCEFAEKIEPEVCEFCGLMAEMAQKYSIGQEALDAAVRAWVERHPDRPVPARGYEAMASKRGQQLRVETVLAIFDRGKTAQ